MPLRHHLEIEPAGIVRRRAHRVGQVELQFGAFSGELPQAAQRQLDVAGAELDGVVEVAELALVPDLDGAAVAFRSLADAHPFRVVAVGAKWRGAAGADPFIAALVPVLLLGEALAQCLHQLFPAAERLDLRFLLVRQVALAELFQPFLGQFGLRVGRGLDALEAMAEDAVELVEIALVLHQRGTRQVVEILHRLVGEIGIQRFHQRQIFAQGHRDLRIAERREELHEHGL